MNKRVFYEQFHNKREEVTQKKIISNNNFTYKLIIQVLNKYLLGESNKLDILDIGCGVGTISLWMAQKGFTVTGIDISSVAIEKCRLNAEATGLKKRTNFYVCDFPESIPRKKFDFIICSEVLEHIKDDQVAIRNIFNLLETRGFIFVSVPSKNAPLYKTGQAKKFDERVGHLRRYSVIEISNLLTNNGFKIIEIKGCEGILRNFLFLNSIAGKSIRFIRGPISDLITFLDNLTIPLFGESDLVVIARKKHNL